ncbi:SET domain-containing protein 9 isoform X1 [Anser cygnoides]|uniref:SET domain-containing protein 9 isoform X1 n=1 Tax=Anser cygnoides TaxID=8845 RepID=UPI0020098E37|nr:SET domain-containing protein 9 isoform X1 [Anser cygnoides]
MQIAARCPGADWLRRTGRPCRGAARRHAAGAAAALGRLPVPLRALAGPQPPPPAQDPPVRPRELPGQNYPRRRRLRNAAESVRGVVRERPRQAGARPGRAPGNQAQIRGAGARGAPAVRGGCPEPAGPRSPGGPVPGAGLRPRPRQELPARRRHRGLRQQGRRAARGGGGHVPRCIDGVLIDGNDKGLSKAVYRSCSRRDQLGPFQMSDVSWLTAAPQNPLAVGQYVNNCSYEKAANVCYQEFDVPRCFPVELKQYLPNIVYSHDIQSPLRCVVLVTLRDIKQGEELFSNYYTVIN